MASNGSSKAASSAMLGKIPAAIHQHDDWLIPAARSGSDAKFASMVLDVSRGTRVIASIMCSHLVDLHDLANDGSSKKLLNVADTEALARLAVLSLDHLYRLSADQVDAHYTKAESGVRA